MTMRWPAVVGIGVLIAGCGGGASTAPSVSGTTVANAATAGSIDIGDVPWAVGDSYTTMNSGRATIDLASGPVRRMSFTTPTWSRAEVLAVSNDSPSRIRVRYEVSSLISTADDGVPTVKAPIPQGQDFVLWRDQSGLHGTNDDGSPIDAAAWKDLAKKHSELGRDPMKMLIAGRVWHVGKMTNASVDELKMLNSGRDPSDHSRYLSIATTLLQFTAEQATFDMVTTTSIDDWRVTYTSKATIDRPTGRLLNASAFGLIEGTLNGHKLRGRGVEVTEMSW